MLDVTSPRAAKDVAAHDAPKRRRKFWLQQLHQWHWISSAVCLIGMLLFSITGITLNHAGKIEAKPRVERKIGTLPPALLDTLVQQNGQTALSSEVADWLAAQLSAETAHRELEWSEDELYIALPRPGGDAWVSIDLASGDIEYERTDRGWISYFNDLHKGRHTGAVWSGFIDVFAIASLVFCLTGLLLLQLHSKHRPSTWPLVGLGFGVMLVIMIAFVH
jgi:hypothetical protein